MQNSINKISSYVLTNRINSMTDAYMSPSQYRFLKDKLMDNIPLSVQTFLTSTINTSVIAIDFAKAFNTCLMSSSYVLYIKRGSAIL
uniref:Zinc finger protein 224like [Anolis carolinensis] n=1 Tax=Lepeophtheirus salmonis TaxID=72036 RepID=A0A0K2V0J8_LEPSM